MNSFWSGWINRKEDADDLDPLRDIPLFDGLSPSQLEHIEELLYERQYQSEETVFSRNDPATALYIIESGAVDIVLDHVEGPRKKISTQGKGTFLGERALCSDHRRTATAIASEACVLKVLFRQELMELIQREQDLGITVLTNLIQVLGDRLNWTNEKLEDLMLEHEPGKEDSG